VTIGHDVWLGASVMIFGGLSIANGAMIGACSMVRKDVPPYAIAYGSPALVAKYRFEKNVVERLLASRWWDRKEEDLRDLPFDNVRGCLDRLLPPVG